MPKNYTDAAIDEIGRSGTIQHPYPLRPAIYISARADGTCAASYAPGFRSFSLGKEAGRAR